MQEIGSLTSWAKHGVQVPFSEFVQRIRGNDVAAVAVDDRRVSFAVRGGSSLLGLLPRGADERTKLTFRTVRPADFNMPYDTMLRHKVEFAATDRRGNRLFTVMVRSSKDLLPLLVLHNGVGKTILRFLSERGSKLTCACSNLKQLILATPLLNS